jgi:hypothetical protein
MRKFMCAAVVVLVGLSVALAEEFTGSITKIEGNKVTVKKFEKGEKGKKGGGEEKVYELATGAKFYKGKFDAETKKLTKGDEIKSEEFNEMVSKGAKGGGGKGFGGTFGTIVTDDSGKITEIRVFSFGGGKKKKKDAE